MVVNKHKLVNIEGPLEAGAIRILRDMPGITVTAVQAAAGLQRPHALVCFAGVAKPVEIEVRRHANAAIAWQLVHRTRTIEEAPLLLIAATTTEEARDILIRHGIAVLDSLGNAHLELPGLLLHIEGRGAPRPDATRVRSVRLTGKAGLAAQALLLEHDREWKVQDLAKRAAISGALAHRVLARLEREQLMEATGSGPKRVRRVTNPTGLLDLWTEEESKDRGVERFRAYRLAREPGELVEAVSAHLDKAEIEHAVTGPAAATRLAPFITAIPVAEIWIASAALPQQVAEVASAEPVETGHNLVFAQARGDEPLAFRRKVEGTWIVNPFRLFFDLRSDPRRGREQADRVRQEVIGF